MENFHTGKLTKWNDFSIELRLDGSLTASKSGLTLIEQFKRNCKTQHKVLRKGSKILEIGSGFGYNLYQWAKIYKKSDLVGCDLDLQAIESSKTLVKNKNLDKRIKFFGDELQNLVKNNSISGKFEVAILNQVIHEMDNSNEYRINILNTIYDLLSETGVLMLGEHMVPKMENILSKNLKLDLFEISHEWLEVALGSNFYDEKALEKLVMESKFNSVEKLGKKGNYCHVIRK